VASSDQVVDEFVLLFLPQSLSLLLVTDRLKFTHRLQLHLFRYQLLYHALVFALTTTNKALQYWQVGGVAQW